MKPEEKKRIEEGKAFFCNYRNKKFRELQDEAIEFLLSSKKRFTFLEAPTGAGKSLISMVTAHLSGKSNYAVHSKILQHQITSDFPEARSLFGRSNYPCIVDKSMTCDECSHSETTPCERKGSCVYEIEKKAAMKHDLRILNYDYLLTEQNYVGRMTAPLTLIDEADNLEGTLIDFVALMFTEYALSRLSLGEKVKELHMTSVNKESLITSWKDFATLAKTRALNLLDDIQGKVDSFKKPYSDQQRRVFKDRVSLERMIQKLTIFLHNVDSSWLYDRQEGKHIFRPLWLTEELSQQFLWRFSQKWIFMSATFLPVHIEAKRLGIPLDEIAYKSLPSTFPPERRPIHVMSVANLSSKTMDKEAPKLIKAIKEIVDKHPDEKGLIHAVSYKLADRIIEGVGNPRLITHNSKNRQEILDRFLNSDSPLVLVSPSMERGVSLPMDLCLVPGTLVRTSKGYVEIENIKVGDLVWTHKRRYCKVKGKMEREYDGNLVKIKTYGGRETLITPNHPILCDHYGNRKPYLHPELHRWLLPSKPYKASPYWKEAGDICVGDSVLLPFGDKSQFFKPLGITHITSKRAKGKTIPQSSSHWQESKEFWELVGLWAAEGSLSHERKKRPGKGGQPRIHYTIQFSFGSHEQHTLAERCCRLIAEAIGNKRPTPRMYSGNRCVVTFKNDAFAVWLKRNVGEGAKTKRVPLRLLHNKSKDYQESFLAGFSDGDGHYYKSGDFIEIGIANEKMALQLRDLALQLNYTASCGKRNTSGRDIDGHDTYVWKMTFSLHERQAKRCRVKFLRTKVKSIKSQYYAGKVYNLQVEKDESYAIDNLCVHNCRFIIVAKAPFLSLGDKITAARLYSRGIGEEWYGATMLLSVLQMTGRGSRSIDDFCENWILDEQFERVYNKKLLTVPSWWRDAVVW